MLLNSLEIQGFKTFPDRTVLKFNDSFVAVVGPNGSGKSNVSDAIKWVLGEQSLKTLRCSKMEDVIFKGASGRKAMGYAEVVLNIDNSSRELNFDNDELSVSRRYYASGDSEYLINGTQVRLKDINELFMDTGLGRDGYSIISQGKIDSIVSAKSEERREIFEEASGISKYRYRKEESERRLARAEENLVRLRDIFEEVESRVEPLRVQAEKAERFIELDSEKSTLETSILYDSYKRAEAVLRTQGAKIFTAENDYNKAVKYSDSIEQEIEDINSGINLNISRIDENRKSISSLNESAVKTDGEVLVFRNDISHNEQNIERLRKDLADSSSSHITEKIEETADQIKKLSSEKDDLNQQLDNETGKLADLTASQKKVQDEIAGVTSKINENLSRSAEKKAAVSSVESILNEIAARKNNVDSRIDSAKQELIQLVAVKQDTVRLIENCRQAIESKNNIISGYSRKLDNKEKTAAKLKSDIDGLTLDIGENSRRAKILEDLEKNYEGYNLSVKAVLKESERGLMPGIHGPVSKLIKVDSEYSAAIETALGQSLQNIVVDDERAAHSAIDFLKRKKIGRATFLPLTTISGTELSTNNIEVYPGFIGLASKLVDCDTKYESFKRFLLGRIIIADNLDNAGVIAKAISYRNRIVTLDGQVINAGGSFTGGSLARNAGILNRSNEIKAFRNKVSQLEKSRTEFQLTYKNIEADIASLRADVDLIQSELSDVNADLIRRNADLSKADADIRKAKESIEGLELEKSDSAKRVETLLSQEKALSEELAELNSESSKYDADLKSLQKESDEGRATSVELNTSIQNLRILLVTLDKDISVRKESLETLRSQINAQSENLARINAEIEALSSKNRLILIDIDSKEHEAERLRTEAKGKEKEIEAFASSRENLEKQLHEKRDEEKKAAASREALAKELAVLREQTESLHKELNDISTELWNEYELSVLEAGEKSQGITDLTASKKRLNELKNKIRALGSVNVGAVVEYKEVKERYEFLKVQIGDINKSRLELLRIIGELTTNMESRFSEKFAEINKNFTEIFSELFGGGKASLSFTNTDDLLNSGIEIKVHPPGKIVSNIEALSGGEKALAAIAIYFAIMKVNPPPFCILDEVEAALDDENVRRFAEYLHRLNDKTQFIVITHRRGTMESAQSLFGVTMQDDGISKVLLLSSTDVDSTMAS